MRFAPLTLVFVAALSGCGFLSNYTKPGELKKDVEPVLVSVVYVLGQGGSDAPLVIQVAFNAADDLLRAIRKGSDQEFLAMVPCAVDAFQEAAKVLPKVQAKVLLEAARVLGVLVPGKGCKDED